MVGGASLEMRRDVGTRSQATLLFGRPQAEPDRAPRPQVQLVENPRDLENDRSAGGIVGRPGSRVS